MSLDALLEQDPATLEPSGAAAAPWLELRERYREELVAVAADAEVRRAALEADGLSADLTVREGELLYLVVREARPETVVEISPRHGYSSGFLLAALAANGAGELWTYELSAEANGRPIDEVIRAHLTPGLPLDRLHVTTGDARSADIPRPDVLFVDSAHEDHFAAWALATQASRAAWVVQHDLVIDAASHFEPKAWYLGPREPAFTLECLDRNGERFFSAAAARRYEVAAGLVEAVPGERVYERAILYRGHAPSPASAELARLVELLHRYRREAVDGVRPPADELPQPGSLVESCLVATFELELSYTVRRPPRPAGPLSTAQLVYLQEYAWRSGSLRELLRCLGPRLRAANPSFARRVRRLALRRAFGR